MAAPTNPCAGPFGALYDFYIEREWLSWIVGHMYWGIDVRSFYRSMQTIAQAADAATILDVPCGGGVALRALRPEQELRYIAADLSSKMLARAKKRAARKQLHQVEFVQADMCDLPVDDHSVDLCVSYSGLHAVPDPQQAVGELSRCLKPGGELLGSTFLREGTRRQRWFFKATQKAGLPAPEFSRQDLIDWLVGAGIENVTVEPNWGFALFSGRKQDPGSAG